LLKGIVTAFVEILICGGRMFRDVLLEIINTAPRPPAETPGFFMHCTTGNNRTGVFIALLLLLLRVPTASVCDEYALSDQGLGPTIHINVKRLLAKGAFSEYGDEAQARCERMVSARRESMAALIEEVRRRWDGPEGYFRKELGFDDGQIEAVRDLFTVRSED
jgi:protein tyrosine/serine phosphatase